MRNQLIGLVFGSLIFSAMAFAGSPIHCPRENEIYPLANGGGGFYTASDGLFTPWAGRTKDGIQHTHFKFERVEFHSSNDRDYYFSGCYYTADGVRLKMETLDGDRVEANFHVADQTANFHKNGNRLVCDSGALSCGFVYN